MICRRAIECPGAETSYSRQGQDEMLLFDSEGILWCEMWTATGFRFSRF